jgi:crotonobetainyl-CoA:carnitine CoA-transferase CaiB-like acyl-CoA transferase
MTPSLERLAGLMGIGGLERFYGDVSAAMTERDTIKARIAEAVALKTTADWLAILQPADIWCAEVLDWPELFRSEAFRRLGMVQRISGPEATLDTLRGPIRLDGAALYHDRAAPALGEDRDRIIREFGLGVGARGDGALPTPAV